MCMKAHCSTCSKLRTCVPFPREEKPELITRHRQGDLVGLREPRPVRDGLSAGGRAVRLRASG